MSGLEKVLGWLAESDSNKKAFAEDINVVTKIDPNLSASDMSVISKIHSHSVMSKINDSTEVLGMRSYGWADTTGKP